MRVYGWSRNGPIRALPMGPSEARRGMTRWVATIAGLIGFVLSVATPLLPVVQTTATLNWPQNGQLNDVTAPLISQVPVTMTVTVPCDVIRSMPPNGWPGAGYRAEGRQAGRPQRVCCQRHRHPRRHHRPQCRGGQRAAGAPVSPPQCQRIEITSSEAGTFATFVGLTEPDDGQGTAHRVRRPEPAPAIVGVFTDLTGPAPPGLSLSATIDTRFSTKPTVLKLAAMVLAITATVVALVALWRLDRLDGRRMRRLDPRAVAHVHRHRRRRGRRVPAVACHRRELVRTTATSSAWPASPGTPATCRTTSAGSAARRTRSAGTTTCWR